MTHALNSLLIPSILWVQATLWVKLDIPEEASRSNTQSLLQQVKQLAEKSRTNEPAGNVEAYELYHSGAGPFNAQCYQGPYFLREVYGSKEAQEAHGGTAHMKAFREWRDPVRVGRDGVASAERWLTFGVAEKGEGAMAVAELCKDEVHEVDLSQIAAVVAA